MADFRDYLGWGGIIRVDVSSWKLRANNGNLTRDGPSGDYIQSIPTIHTHTHKVVSHFLIPRDGFDGPSGADGQGWRAFGISPCPAGCPGHDPSAFDPISRWMRRWTSDWQSGTWLHLATWPEYSLAHTYATPKTSILHKASANSPQLFISKCLSSVVGR